MNESKPVSVSSVITVIITSKKPFNPPRIITTHKHIKYNKGGRR